MLLCTLGIVVESSIQTIDVEITEVLVDKDEKPSFYEYFGGLNPQVKLAKYIQIDININILVYLI